NDEKVLVVDQNGNKNTRNRRIVGKALFNNTLVNYLCDTGADRSIINIKTFNLIRRYDPNTVMKPYEGGKLNSCKNKMKIFGVVYLKRCLIVPSYNLENTMVIVTENITDYDCLIGRDLINKIPYLKKQFFSVNSTLNEMSEKIKKIFYLEMLEGKNKKFQAKPSLNRVKVNSDEDISDKDSRQNGDEITVIKEKSAENEDVELIDNSEKNINLEIKNSSDERKKLNYTVVKPIEFEHIDQNEFIEAESKIKQEFESISANSVAELVPEINHGFTFKIEFIDPNQKPTRCKCRPLSWNLKDKLRLEIENQVKARIIRSSKSPWCFPIRVVAKQNGEIRITVHYKELNKVIKDDNQPLPSINDLYTMMTDSDVFTKFDLKSAYHQIAVHEESVEVTAFICEFWIFEYLFMPLGIKIALAKFQKFIEKIFGKFINDSFIFTNTLKYGLKTHIDTVMDVIQTLKQNSLKISMEKSVSLAYEIELLGNVITKNSIKPNPKRSKCLETRPKPVKMKDLQSWLVVAN
ncbi:unnamed protein product, partial [Brachionus calyciflorus]